MTVTTENGDEYTCERVVLAVPPNMTGKVKGQLRSHLGQGYNSPDPARAL